jgi:TPR repeat protein
LAWALLAGTAAAAPPDDHQRGLQALQRGDVIAAMAALRPAAQAGHAPSQSLLAHILDRADFSEQAAQLWRQAAAQGDAEAHAGLASMALTGRGIAKDEKLALLHFSEAAARGHAASVHWLADAWLQGRLGTQAATQPEEARAVLLRAAEQGHLPSIDALAAGHTSGAYGLPVDAAQRERWRARALALRAQRSTTAAGGAASAARQP